MDEETEGRAGVEAAFFDSAEEFWKGLADVRRRRGVVLVVSRKAWRGRSAPSAGDLDDMADEMLRLEAAGGHAGPGLRWAAVLEFRRGRGQRAYAACLRAGQGILAHVLPTADLANAILPEREWGCWRADARPTDGAGVA